MSVSQEERQVRDLISRGQNKGFLTNDEVNRALPPGYLPEQLDELLTALKLMGIRVIDRDEPNRRRPAAPADPQAPGAGEERSNDRRTAGGDDVEGAYGRTNDPVRVYLRKMGSVSLLTREGEVEIAKRIEEGQFKVRDAVLSSPVSVQIALELIQRIEQKTSRVKDVLIEPGEGVEDPRGPHGPPQPPAAARSFGSSASAARLEERLAGCSP